MFRSSHHFFNLSFKHILLTACTLCVLVNYFYIQKNINTSLVETLVDNDNFGVTIPPNEISQVSRIGTKKCLYLMDVQCIKQLWIGAAVTELPKKNEISVAITSCSPEYDMSLFDSYVNNGGTDIVVKNTIIIPCNSELDGSYRQLQWLANATSPSAINPKYYYQDNHYILFLKGDMFMGDPPRPLEEVLLSTIEYGYGCVQGPSLYKNYPKSYYHDRAQYRTYAAGVDHHMDIGEWQDLVNVNKIIDKNLIPVCYGGSFAISSRELLLKSKVYSPILQKISTHSEASKSYEIISKYLERSWAGMFSYHLSKNDVLLLRKFKTNIFNNKCCQNGVLLHRLVDSSLSHVDMDSAYFKFFTGDTLKYKNVDYSELRVSLVISHCNEDMSWMNKYHKDFQIQDVVIYSKCNSTIEGYSHPKSKIIRPPNIGRCDHSYAHWMRQMKENDATNNHIVLFIKASRNLYQAGMAYRSLKDVIRITQQNGFSCEAMPYDKSFYYNSTILKTFAIHTHKSKEKIKSEYSSMGSWLNDMGIELPAYAPVCYGGNFAAKATQIYSKRMIWEKMETSLMRGDSIEEGHFAERTWAALLSHPLTLEETDVLKKLVHNVNGVLKDGYKGEFIHQWLADKK